MLNHFYSVIFFNYVLVLNNISQLYLFTSFIVYNLYLKKKSFTLYLQHKYSLKEIDNGK